MDRRRFLELTGAAAAATLAGCGGGSSSTTPSPPPPPDWTGLGTGMQGTLLRSSDVNYETIAHVFNRRYDAILPTAIARCASPNDVKLALAFVRKNNFAVTPRCGGHNYAGYSVNAGVVIDVRPMNSIQINNNGTATIGAGALLTDVYDQLISQGVSIPIGTCPSVGIAGLTMGGGFSVVGRKYGLTCDNLVAAQVVTADGRILTCDATNEPNLFWALRGGGGGNFGIATSFTFKTHTAGDLTNFAAAFNFADAAKVLAAWQAWPTDLPDSIWAQVFMGFQSSTSTPTFSVYGVCVGTADELAPYWAAFLAATQSTPVASNVWASTYRDTALSFCGNWTVSQCHFIGETSDAQMTGDKFVGSSDFFYDPLPAEGIQTLLTKIQDQQNAGTNGYVILDLMGGAIGAPAAGDTAFVHRAGLFSAEYWLFIDNATDPLSWANDMRVAMSPWSGGAYVNYMDPFITNGFAAYYGSNFAKLVQVKAQYDPDWVFHLPQGVPPVMPTV